MLVLHTSDLGSPEFMALYAQCDVVFATGDIDTMDWIPVLKMAPNLRKPAFGVYGNHDQRFMERFGVTDVHARVVDYRGIRIGGFQGCIRYKDSPFLFTEAEAQQWARDFPVVDVLLTHAGPEGMLDDHTDEIHAGSKAVR